jgi:uncharacterized membrane protein (DUF106 family)
MGRVLIGVVIAAIIAGLIFFFIEQNYRTQSELQAQQIEALNQRIAKLQGENQDLKTALSKVQNEQNAIAAQNEELRKAIAQFKATGKMPETPAYPPK